MMPSYGEIVAGWRERQYNALRTAREMGVSPTTVTRAIKAGRLDGSIGPDERRTPGLTDNGRDREELPPDPPVREAPFTISHVPDPDRPIDDIITDRMRQSERMDKYQRARKLIEVPVKIEGPFAIAFIGDPHLDNPGTDFRRLFEDIQIIKDTPAMLAGSVGDYRDNWVGRLSKLYAQTGVSESETRKLVEWFFSTVPWLFLIAGNHDLWNSEGGNILDYIYRLGGVPGRYEKYDLKMKIIPPSGRTFTVHARHDFPGTSQYNPAHGPVRETLFNYRSNVLVCGDRHHSGYAPVWHNDPEPRLCHAMRVGTYKVHDDHAQEKGFREGNYAPSMAVVVDPSNADPVEWITWFPSLRRAASYLTHLRRERGFERAAA